MSLHCRGGRGSVGSAGAQVHALGQWPEGGLPLGVPGPQSLDILSPAHEALLFPWGRLGVQMAGGLCPLSVNTLLPLTAARQGTTVEGESDSDWLSLPPATRLHSSVRSERMMYGEFCPPG